MQHRLQNFAIGLGDDKPGMSGGVVTVGGIVGDGVTSLVVVGVDSVVDGMGQGSGETCKQVDSTADLESPIAHRSDKS